MCTRTRIRITRHRFETRTRVRNIRDVYLSLSDIRVRVDSLAHSQLIQASRSNSLRSIFRGWNPPARARARALNHCQGLALSSAQRRLFPFSYYNAARLRSPCQIISRAERAALIIPNRLDELLTTLSDPIDLASARRQKSLRFEDF